MTFLKIKQSFLLVIILTILLFIFYSFRLAETPDGITADEASYGYNGISLADNLHDQNGRFLPIFILGTDGVTWYPPYMQYLAALFFKLLGPSVFAMRFATVFVTVLSALLMFYFARLLLNKKYGLIALLSFMITPEVLIETHTPFEHMIVIPFVLIWLISLYKYKLHLERKYLIFAALSLGISIYSYGGVRPLVPIWVLASSFYIIYLTGKQFLAPLLTFAVTILPFFAIIPILEHYYSGAVLNRVSFKVSSIYSFFYYYLASFDISFLFVTGDKLLVQSTGRHGMFLLSTLPIFLVGIYQAFRKGSAFLTLLGVTFFISPLLYGFVGSAFFAHRLLYMVPFYCVFFILGIKKLLENRYKFLRYGSFILIFLIMINFLDFWRYYIFNFPKDTYHLFHHLEDRNKPYQELYHQAKNRGLEPFLSTRVARLDKVNISDPELFSRALYFPKLPNVLDEQKDLLPENGILLSDQDNLPNVKKLAVDILPFHLYIRP
ncbi:glycosyltransferase family 39 protein [Candidatus Daviesbacteria bacterium]|nr:glycosyltransferase family 39 protein [Candidatus Daviesbacteria bacterium]